MSSQNLYPPVQHYVIQFPAEAVLARRGSGFDIRDVLGYNASMRFAPVYQR